MILRLSEESGETQWMVLLYSLLSGHTTANTSSHSTNTKTRFSLPLPDDPPSEHTGEQTDVGEEAEGGDPGDIPQLCPALLHGQVPRQDAQAEPCQQVGVGGSRGVGVEYHFLLYIDKKDCSFFCIFLFFHVCFFLPCCFCLIMFVFLPFFFFVFYSCSFLSCFFFCIVFFSCLFFLHFFLSLMFVFPLYFFLFTFVFLLHFFFLCLFVCVCRVSFSST